MLSDEHPPSFFATQGGAVWRIFVPSDEVLFIKLRAKFKVDSTQTTAMGGLIGGGLGNAIAQHDEQVNAERNFENQIEQESEMLDKRNADGLRIYIKSMKRGFVARPKDFEDIRIDVVGKWKRWFFGTPKPALFVNHRKEGEGKFIFRSKPDIVIAIHELRRLLGDDLEIEIDLGDYKKALKKYEKRQS